MRMNRYIVKSLELHLFFARIMKEHSFFLQAGFTPAEAEWAAKAEAYRKEFEKLLARAVDLSDGIVGREVVCSGEIVTEFTLMAEKQTQCLTGIPVDQDITDRELALNWGECRSGSWAGLCREVRQMNLTARKLLEGLISFKEAVLDGVLQGRLFTVNYPLLIEHITREAKLYRRFVETLDRKGDIPMCTMKEVECFWNRIMMEHAQFIRGLLDPCEAELMNTADDFAQKYCRLLEASRGAQDQTLTQQTLEETVKFRDFKAAGTQGIQQCRIRSIILPLLADHVLREANHYIRLMQH